MATVFLLSTVYSFVHPFEGAAGGVHLGGLDGLALAGDALVLPDGDDAEDACVGRPLGGDEVVVRRDAPRGLEPLLEQRLVVGGGGRLGRGVGEVWAEGAVDELGGLGEAAVEEDGREHGL